MRRDNRQPERGGQTPRRIRFALWLCAALCGTLLGLRVSDSGVVLAKEAGETVRIEADSLNVRSGPGKDYAVIGSAGAGEEYEAAGEIENGWYPIRFGDGTGYVSGDFVTVLPAQQPSAQQEEAPPAEEEEIGPISGLPGVWQKITKAGTFAVAACLLIPVLVLCLILTARSLLRRDDAAYDDEDAAYDEEYGGEYDGGDDAYEDGAYGDAEDEAYADGGYGGDADDVSYEDGAYDGAYEDGAYGGDADGRAYEDGSYGGDGDDVPYGDGAYDRTFDGRNRGGRGSRTAARGDGRYGRQTPPREERSAEQIMAECTENFRREFAEADRRKRQRAQDREDGRL